MSKMKINDVPIEPEKTFARFIKAIRKQKSWNTKQLGARLNISSRTIESWEQGRRHPKGIFELIELAKEL